MDSMYTSGPLDLIATKREQLSEDLRGIIDKKGARYEQDRYWLRIWIKEYDTAIAVLKKNAGDPNHVPA